MEFVKRNSSVMFIGDKKNEHHLPEMFRGLVDNLAIPYLKLDEFEIENLIKKNLRLHSRNTNGLIYCLESLDILNQVKKYSNEKVGIYIACERHNLDGDLPNFCQNINDLNYFELMREKYNPTYVIKNESGIIPGHLSIYFNLNGPSYTCTSGSYDHLIEKATWDLKLGYVEIAIVGVVNIYDDPFKLIILNSKSKNEIPKEFIAVMLMNLNQIETNRSEFVELINNNI